VHPDRVFFEAFSQDGSAYGLLVVDRSELEEDGEVVCGTTNVDFTAWLHGALGDMRSRRTTTLGVEAGGVEVRTEEAGGRFEQKVDLPESWVRGFLEVSSAMAFPGTRIEAKPVDVLSAIRFLQQNKAKVSPRAIRYELLPDRDAEMVLEPWEKRVTLAGAEHSHVEPRTIRTWGRRRLRLIEPLLPYADRVEIYLKGRAMPSFYAVVMPGYTFVLGLSGWTGNRMTEHAGFATPAPVDEPLVRDALTHLRERTALTVAELAALGGWEKPVATAALDRLVRRGRAIFDLRSRAYRHRELFQTPIDESSLFPPDDRAVEAERWIREGGVRVENVAVRETRKVRSFKLDGAKIHREIVHRDWVLSGEVADQPQVEAVVSEEGRILFGKCGCERFREHMLSKGPCAHLVALDRASAASRQDLPTSVDAPEPATPRHEGLDDAEEDSDG